MPPEQASAPGPGWHRRGILLAVLALAATPARALGTVSTWTTGEAHDGLLADSARVIDIRSRAEWSETGVGAGVWPLSMHDPNFPARLFAAKELAGDRPLGLICATGGRSGAVMAAILRAGYPGYADIPEGMMGSDHGPGWIGRGLPVVPIDTALAALPGRLR